MVQRGISVVEVPLKLYIQGLAKQAHAAARPLSLMIGRDRTLALTAMADRLEVSTEDVLEANRRDLDAIPREWATDDYRKARDQIAVTEEQVMALVTFVRRMAGEPDPAGEVSQGWVTQDGLRLHRVRVPIGVIAVISEFGPDVTAESIAMCLRSGNVCILRGGREWFRTNAEVARILREAAEAHGVPPGAVTFVDRPDREGVLELTRLRGLVHGVVPRGKAGLRKAVMEQSRVPVLGYDGGLCHVYVDKETDVPLAQSVVVNSKIQDPLAANSLDVLLVHQAVSQQLLPGLIRRLLGEFGVELIGCPKTISIMGIMEMTGHKGIRPATAADWGQKRQSLTLGIKIVGDLDEGIAHIAAVEPGHTDAIVTRNYQTAMRFVREVDSSAVLVNASTRLHAGTQMDLGEELGVNVSHVPVRGPLTLQALMAEKYVGFGTGQLREPHPVPQAYQDAMMLSAKF